MYIDKIRRTSSRGIFHDSRTDVRNLANKLNECIEVINEQQSYIDMLRRTLYEQE